MELVIRYTSFNRTPCSDCHHPAGVHAKTNNNCTACQLFVELGGTRAPCYHPVPDTSRPRMTSDALQKV